MNTKHGAESIRWWMAAGLTAFLLAALMPNAGAQRDRGLNQPGAAGNRGGDPGVNQPGAVGNAGRDPGVNQPGAVGNVGRDPGLNQPGAAGNRGVGVGGSARQTRVVGDPGVNQPGRVGRR